MLEKWQNRKNAVRFLEASAVLLFLGWVLLIWNELAVTEFQPDSIPVVALEDGYRCNVESLNCDRDNSAATKDDISFSGWFIKPGEDIRTASLKIVLKNQETEKYYLIPTAMDTRKDVTDFFSGEHNYDCSGFHVKIPYDGRIHIEQYDYEIYVLYTLNEENTVLVSLGTTLKTWRTQG